MILLPLLHTDKSTPRAQSPEPPSTRETWIYWRGFSKGLLKWLRNWKDWELGLKSGEERAWRTGSQHAQAIWRDGATIKPSSPQWHPVPGQEVTSTNWITGGSTLISANIFFLYGWLSTATGYHRGCGASTLEISKGCLGTGLGNLLWWHCLKSRGGQENIQESLSHSVAASALSCHPFIETHYLRQSL